jgi:hypothetical protein
VFYKNMLVHCDSVILQSVSFTFITNFLMLFQDKTDVSYARNVIRMPSSLEHCAWLAVLPIVWFARVMQAFMAMESTVSSAKPVIVMPTHPIFVQGGRQTQSHAPVRMDTTGMV